MSTGRFRGSASSLEEQFQPKTWSNKLQLRQKLYALKLREGRSVNEHIKAMSEIFEGLAVIGDTVSEEDRVVHLLASLPELYNVLVTALEAQSEQIPKWGLITERLHTLLVITVTNLVKIRRIAGST